MTSEGSRESRHNPPDECMCTICRAEVQRAAQVNTLCARCRTRPRMHPHLGCLCLECEAATEGMTQAELDADYEAHTEGNDLK